MILPISSTSIFFKQNFESIENMHIFLLKTSVELIPQYVKQEKHCVTQETIILFHIHFYKVGNKLLQTRYGGSDQNLSNLLSCFSF